MSTNVTGLLNNFVSKMNNKTCSSNCCNSKSDKKATGKEGQDTVKINSFEILDYRSSMEGTSPYIRTENQTIKMLFSGGYTKRIPAEQGRDFTYHRDGDWVKPNNFTYYGQYDQIWSGSGDVMISALPENEKNIVCAVAIKMNKVTARNVTYESISYSDCPFRKEVVTEKLKTFNTDEFWYSLMFDVISGPISGFAQYKGVEMSQGAAVGMPCAGLGIQLTENDRINIAIKPAAATDKAVVQPDICYYGNDSSMLFTLGADLEKIYGSVDALLYNLGGRKVGDPLDTGGFGMAGILHAEASVSINSKASKFSEIFTDPKCLIQYKIPLIFSAEWLNNRI